MLPGIQDGDLLLVDATENRFRSFGVCARDRRRTPGQARPAQLDGSITLISDNAAYETEHIPPARAADVQVVGRVIWTCGPPRAR
jgi:phage repressor protein C with HTH and peptisase S24 domain